MNWFKILKMNLYGEMFRYEETTDVKKNFWLSILFSPTNKYIAYLLCIKT